MLLNDSERIKKLSNYILLAMFDQESDGYPVGLHHRMTTVYLENILEKCSREEVFFLLGILYGLGLVVSDNLSFPPRDSTAFPVWSLTDEGRASVKRFLVMKEMEAC